jgi:hypothetical protein
MHNSLPLASSGWSMQNTVLDNYNTMRYTEIIQHRFPLAAYFTSNHKTR